MIPIIPVSEFAGGAGTSSRLGILSSASAATPYLAGAGAVIGGVMGGINTSKNNALVRKNAINQYNAIDTQIKQNRTSFYDATTQASAKAQEEMSQISLSLSGFGSQGASNADMLGQISSDKSVSQYYRNMNLTESEKNAAIQKQNIFEQAKASMTNPFLSIITGAIGGAQTGAAIGGAVKGVADSLQNNIALGQFADDWKANGNTTENLARSMAIQAGVEPRFLVDTSMDNPYLSTFIYKIKQNEEMANQVGSMLTNQKALTDLYSVTNQQSINNFFSAPNFRYNEGFYLNRNNKVPNSIVEFLNQNIRGR